jgi:hypothetical protein
VSVGDDPTLQPEVAAITTAVRRMTGEYTPDVCRAAVVAIRHYAARPIKIPQAVTLDAIGDDLLPPPGTLVCYIAEDESIVFGRIAQYAADRVRLRPVGPQGPRPRRWFDRAEVFRDLSHASLALAQQAEDVRRVLSAELDEVTRARDRFLDDARSLPTIGSIPVAPPQLSPAVLPTVRESLIPSSPSQVLVRQRRRSP